MSVNRNALFWYGPQFLEEHALESEALLFIDNEMYNQGLADAKQRRIYKGSSFPPENYSFDKKTGRLKQKDKAAQTPSIEAAKEALQDAIESDFLDDILWTDEELQFWQKRKAVGDDSYDAWFMQVAKYHDESYKAKQKAQASIAKASTIEEIQAVSYKPSHTYTRQALATPKQQNTE